ncbi:hypothetical protein SAMN04487857_111135 [Pseudomonas sp. ok272]|nr:hypothetical protein SAMN04487857_111135 [Pseudomonas sp. ok272]SFN11488.1 hypothetical protein SAMN04487858_112135 [Pseudomonas sp. ok602]
MSWLFSQALVAEYSEATCWAGAPSAPLNVMPTPHKFWRNDKTMEPSHLSRFGLKCAVLTEDHGEALLTSFRAGFPVRTFPPPVAAEESMGLDRAFGGRWQELSVRYDLDSSTWKTHQCLWAEDLPWSSVTLPKWGMTLGGALLERQTSGRSTSAIVSGLWPTPTVHGNHNQPGASKNAGWGLSSAVKLWTTPSASDSTRGGQITSNMSGTSLAQQINTPERWPTPTATDSTRGASPADRLRKSPGLPAAVVMWRTPQASDSNKWSNQSLAERQAKGQQIRLNTQVSPGGGQGGQLNPQWVEWLMGWPIGWTELGPLAMDRFQEWRQQHSSSLQNA